MKSMSHRIAVILFLWSTCMSLPADLLAWSSTGHMTIAAMAYRALPDTVKERYVDLLRHHPDYEAWRAAYDSLEIEIDLGEYLFMRASLWPDEIRRSGGTYNHPTWHYTNFPVVPGAFPEEDTLTPEDDVLFAISNNKRILEDAGVSAVDRAAALSWLLHVIGDIHQPLHCVALVTDVYPEGDRGGNDFFVRPAPDRAPMNLHAFWDRLLGSSGDVRDARNQASYLWQTLSPELLKTVDASLDPRVWALEGRQYAIEYVYLKGELPGATRDSMDGAETLTSEYRKQARNMANERAVIAASRMFRYLLPGSTGG